MQRTLLNLVVDLATALAMLGMVLSGYIIRFPLPPGTNKAWILWGLTRHQWGDVHFWTGAVLLVLVVVHVCLHWNWIVTVIRQRLGRAKPRNHGIVPDAVLVVLALGVGFAGFARIAHHSVERVSEPHTDSCLDDSKDQSHRQVRVPPVETPSETPKLTWDDVYPILVKACLACHGPQKQRAAFRIDRPEALMAGDGKTRWIVPGRSAESALIDVVSGKREIALPSRHRLPDADVHRLRQWIDSGAALTSTGREVRRSD